MDNITVADEIKQFIDERIEKVRDEAKKEQKQSIKCHFDYCVSHAGNDSRFMWLRTELFGKEIDKPITRPA